MVYALHASLSAEGLLAFAQDLANNGRAPLLALKIRRPCGADGIWALSDRLLPR